MKVLVQHARKNPTDWEELDSAQWSTLAKRPLGNGGKDDAPGHIHCVNVQGNMSSGYDHYAVEHLSDGCRVTSWADESKADGQKLALVWTFLTLAPDKNLGGAYNTRHSQVVYAQSEVYKLYESLGPLENTVLKHWEEFIPPQEELTRHDAHLPVEVSDEHHKKLSLRGWMEWTEGLPEEEIEIRDGRKMLRGQRQLGRYIPLKGTQTQYVSNTALTNNIVTADNDDGITPVAGTAGTQASKNYGGGSSHLAFCFTTHVGSPGIDAWPTGTYRCQLNCTAAGAGMSYGLAAAGSATGYFGRADTGLTSALETKAMTNSLFTSTGTKLATTGSVSWTAGAATDRAMYVVAGTRAASTSNQTFTLQLNDVNAFIDGPWTAPGQDDQSSNWSDQLQVAILAPLTVSISDSEAGNWSDAEAWVAGLPSLKISEDESVNLLDPVSYTDDFNRADGPIGGNWNSVGTTPNIVSNMLVVQGNGMSVTWNNRLSADQSVQITWVNSASGTGKTSLSLECRGPSLGGGNPTAQVKDDGTIFIRDTMAGQTFGTATLGAGDVWRFECIGTTLTFYQNGVSVLSRSETGAVVSGYCALVSTVLTGGTAPQLDNAVIKGGMFNPSVIGIVESFVDDQSPNWSESVTIASLGPIGITISESAVPLVTWSDNFNRSDGPLGGGWNPSSAGYGAISISGNSVVCADNASYNAVMWAQQNVNTDQFAQLTWVNGQADITQRTNDIWLLCRCNYAISGLQSNSYRLHIVPQAAGAVTVQLEAHYNDGNNTLIIDTASAPSPAANDVYRLECKGNQITGYFNGSVLVQGTDSNVPSGLYMGFGMYTGAGNSSCIVDNWLAGELGVGAGNNDVVTWQAGVPIAVSDTESTNLSDSELVVRGIYENPSDDQSPNWSAASSYDLASAVSGDLTVTASDDGSSGWSDAQVLGESIYLMLSDDESTNWSDLETLVSGVYGNPSDNQSAAWSDTELVVMGILESPSDDQSANWSDSKILTHGVLPLLSNAQSWSDSQFVIFGQQLLTSDSFSWADDELVTEGLTAASADNLSASDAQVLGQGYQLVATNNFIWSDNQVICTGEWISASDDQSLNWADVSAIGLGESTNCADSFAWNEGDSVLEGELVQSFDSVLLGDAALVSEGQAILISEDASVTWADSQLLLQSEFSGLSDAFDWSDSALYQGNFGSFSMMATDAFSWLDDSASLLYISAAVSDAFGWAENMLTLAGQLSSVSDDGSPNWVDGDLVVLGLYEGMTDDQSSRWADTELASAGICQAMADDQSVNWVQGQSSLLSTVSLVFDSFIWLDVTLQVEGVNITFAESGIFTDLMLIGGGQGLVGVEGFIWADSASTLLSIFIITSASFAWDDLQVSTLGQLSVVGDSESGSWIDSLTYFESGGALSLIFIDSVAWQDVMLSLETIGPLAVDSFAWADTEQPYLGLLALLGPDALSWADSRLVIEGLSSSLSDNSNLADAQSLSESFLVLASDALNWLDSESAFQKQFLLVTDNASVTWVDALQVGGFSQLAIALSDSFAMADATSSLAGGFVDALDIWPWADSGLIASGSAYVFSNGISLTDSLTLLGAISAFTSDVSIWQDGLGLWESQELALVESFAWDEAIAATEGLVVESADLVADWADQISSTQGVGWIELDTFVWADDETLLESLSLVTGDQVTWQDTLAFGGLLRLSGVDGVLVLSCLDVDDVRTVQSLSSDSLQVVTVLGADDVRGANG